jgi:hypothetical protein
MTVHGGGVGGIVPLILALGALIDCSQLHAATTSPREKSPRGGRAPGTHWIGGWVGVIARLDILEKRKSLSPAGIQTPNRPARS